MYTDKYKLNQHYYSTKMWLSYIYIQYLYIYIYIYIYINIILCHTYYNLNKLFKEASIYFIL